MTCVEYLVDHVVGVPVGEEQIDVAVVVVVEELQAPSRQQPRGLSNGIRVRDVCEPLVPVVLVQREHLLVHVGDEKVLEPVLIEVRGVNTHSRTRLPVRAEAHF